MSADTPEELAGLQAAGAVVAEALQEMRLAARAGVRTAELDAIAGEIFAAAGARSGPQLDYDFPGHTCISVNAEAIHGVPGRRKLRAGDLVKLDVTAELHGFYADACVSVCVEDADPDALALIDTAERALAAGLAVARPGVPVNAIGAAVEHVVRERGHAVCRELMGHGIGRRIHEPPDVPNVFVPELVEPLTEGLVMTIEPIIAAGHGDVWETGDGWTHRTMDGSLSAHAEHTVVIRNGEPELLTA